ncbi:MAG: thioredoxin [Clostridia bacterium]|nr:thioredoxin [Clostridia bacterium]
MVIKLNDSNFEEEVLKTDKTVLVDLFATWCGPCEIMSPLIDELAEENLPNVKVGKLDIDESGEIAIKYGVMSIPTFLVFKNGQVVRSFVGVTDIDEIKQAVLNA